MTRLREIRRARNMSQADLAQALGVTEPSVSRYENDPHRLTVPLLEKLARVLNVTIAEILGEESAATYFDNRKAGQARDRHTVCSELENVDLCSIRFLREYVARLEDAPDELRQLERRACDLRRELADAI